MRPTFNDLGSPPLLPFLDVQPSRIQRGKTHQASQVRSKDLAAVHSDHALAGLEALSPTPAACDHSATLSRNRDLSDEYTNIAGLFEDCNAGTDANCGACSFAKGHHSETLCFENALP